MKPRSLSVKQYENVIDLLNAVKESAYAADSECGDGSKSLRDTEAFKVAREKMAEACLILGIEVPKIFEAPSASASKEAEASEELGETDEG